MSDLFLLVPLMVLVTVLLLAWALAAPRESPIQGRLRAYGYNLAERPAGDLNQSVFERLLLPVGRQILRFVYRLTPAGVVSSSREKLRHANSSMGLGTFLAIRLVSALALPGLWLLATRMLRGGPSIFDWFVALFLLYAGHRLPDIILSLRIDARKDELTRSLPDALDLLVVCVEAGYGLEAAIQKVVEATKGPLAEEFSQMLTEVSLGRSRREALKAMSDRCGSTDVQTFIAAILQADQMGVNIATALRVQADAMRVRRRQRAEEQIAKAPIKMLFPMAGFIFPALFVVMLGPSMIRIIEWFGQMGAR